MEKEATLSLMAEKNHLLEEISILKKSLPTVDVNSPDCPFCGRSQNVMYDGIRKIYEICTCQTMRQFRDKQHQLSEYEERLLIIGKQVEQKRKHAERILNESGIGKRFLNVGFENFERERMPDAYDIAFKFADEFDRNKGNGLIFTGGVGTGKTHLAASIASHIINKYSVTVEFVSYVDILADIRAAFSNNTGYEAKIEARLCEAPLLIIDDLGKEKQSKFTDELLYRVVNKRYNHNLPLIITTNLSLPELEARLDYAVFSRIVELCKAVDMRGRDYRMKDFWD